MLWSSLHSVQVSAIFTVDCNTLATANINPISFPGQSPIGTVNSIVGASAFAPGVTFEEQRASNCTTCNVNKDKSNYWVPQLYVHKKSTSSFIPVQNEMHIYYKPIDAKGDMNGRPSNELEQLHPFPPGFRMIAGNPAATTPLAGNSTDTSVMTVSYKCLDAANVLSKVDTPGFPAQPESCDKIRAQVTFPSCWDGVNVDSKDHQSHMSYPLGSWSGSACPPSHPKRTVTLFFEAIFKISPNFQPGDQLVWSTNNDKLGFGFHGDFLSGWDETELDNAIQACLPGGATSAACLALIQKQDSPSCVIQDAKNNMYPNLDPVSKIPVFVATTRSVAKKMRRR